MAKKGKKKAIIKNTGEGNEAVKKFLEESETVIQTIADVYEHCVEKYTDPKTGKPNIRNGVDSWIEKTAKIEGKLREKFGDQANEFLEKRYTSNDSHLEYWVRAFGGIVEKSEAECESWKDDQLGPIPNYHDITQKTGYVVNTIAKRLVDENKILNGYKKGESMKRGGFFIDGQRAQENSIQYAAQYKAIQEANGTYIISPSFRLACALFCCAVLLSFV